MAPCIWTLLSVNGLEFISTSDFHHQLKSLSLFQLFHPEEVSMAKRDLFKSARSNFLGGSVTRCRLKDYTKHDFSVDSNQYIIMDVIMYVATKDLILAFLHYPESPTTKSYLSLCGDNNINGNKFCVLTLKKSLIAQDKLLFSPLLSPSSIESAALHKYSDPSPHQSLYIIDSQTKSVLLSWPDHYPNKLGSADYYYSNLISWLDDRPMLPGISCCRCVQQPSRTNSRGQKLDSLIIEYGSVTFLLVCLERSIPPSPSPSSNTHNQLDGYPFRRTSEPFNQVNLQHRQQRKYQPYPALENLLIPNSDYIHSYTNNNKRHCQSCGTESSPEWRRGPTGHKTLCNACGLRYSRSVARQGKMIANHHHHHHHHHSLIQGQNAPQRPSAFFNNQFVSSN